LTASDSPAAGDNLTVQGGVTIQSTGGNVTLRAGDNLDLQAGSTIQAAGTITGFSDFGDADSGVGTTVNLLGSLLATSASFTGGGDPDTFNVVSSPTTPLSLDGGPPSTFPGDILNFDAQGLSFSDTGS